MALAKPVLQGLVKYETVHSSMATGEHCDNQWELLKAQKTAALCLFQN